MRPGWDIPLNSILVSFAVCCVLSLINIGSSVAFNAFVSLGVASLVSSYILSIGCILVKRVRGGQLPRARWSLGRLAVPFNAVAVVYLSVVFVISFFPPAREVEVDRMQWSSAMFGGVVVFATGYYYVHGRHQYDGPVVLVKRS